jgi:3-oxoacyl-(acyl-carrier-protein) synthase
MIPSEGAGAILLGREGKVGIEQVHSGGIFWRRQQATKLIAQVISDLSEAKANLFVGSANGTFIDLAESSAMAKIVPRMSIYSCKPALGESVGASAIWQVIVAAQSLATGKVPPLLHLEESNPLTRQHPQQPNGAIVLSCGMNQQVAGARLAI